MSRPEIEHDERFADLLQELRGHGPEPSPALMARVERIAEQPASQPRPQLAGVLARRSGAWWWSGLVRRRALLALAGAAVVVALAGGVLIGSRGNRGSVQRANPGLAAGQAAQKPATLTSPDASTFGAAQPRGGARVPSATSDAAARERQATSPLTTGRRLAELRAELTLRVRSQRELADATGRAERIARGAGGYVAGASYNSRTESGSSFLKLKVPAARAQVVLARLTRLGELLAQSVQLEDLKATVDGQSAEIRSFQAQIRKLVAALRDPALSAEARDQLKVQIALLQSRLKSVVGSRSATRARGVYATISLTLTTERAQAVPSQPGRIHEAFDDARDGLAREIAWVVRAAVVAAPLLVLAALLLLAARQRRRRLEQRLLARS